MSDAVLADAEARAQAVDPTRSFIVQAPAGSGKTELLTRRILTLLACVDEPEEILAITFTRKAASEMRQRVLRSLRDAEQQRPLQNDYEREGRVLAEAVLARDTERQWQLLENPARLAMQTIDSLCSVLTRQLPVTSNFGAELSVQEDARRLYMQAAQRCIESSLQTGELGHGELRLLLAHLDNNVERVQRLLADMLASRDQWLRHYSQASSREQLEGDLQALVGSRFDSLATVIPLADLRELITLYNFAQHNAYALDTAADGANLLELDELPVPSYGSAATWQLLADFLLTKGKGNIRKSLTRREGFPSSKADAQDLGVTVDELRQRKAQMSELLEILRQQEGVEALLKETRELPLGGYDDAQWDVMCSLLELLMLSVAELHLVFAESGSVDFTEIALRASRALGHEDAPTDLALALDYRLRHILVDEFQDTSISQDGLFRKLLAGWEPGDGRTFFAVGDPMQSIYRFRDAEVSLFLRAREYGIAGVTLTPLQLEVNFRSDQAIVHWCNDAFSQVFPTEADMTTGAVNYAASIPARKHSAQAGQYFHAFVDADRTAQADWVGELTATALDDGNADGTIAILVRSKSVLREIFPALQQRNIAYQAVDIETLGDRLVVKDILSLCRALQHPQDRIHWLAVLRAPWCGLTLDDLHTLVDGEPAATVWSLVNNEARTALLTADAQQRVNRLREIMQPAVESALRESVSTWVEAVWLSLGGPAACQYEQDLLAADACFAELRAIEEAGLLRDARHVDDRLDQLFAPALQGPDVRVQIMTIHKSKGLEFDTVILPSLERRSRGDETRLLNWFEYFSEGAAPRLLLAPIPETNIGSEQIPAIVRMVKRLQAQKSANELQRLLYVAATRARHQLHMLGTVTCDAKEEFSAPAADSLLSPLWPVVVEEFDSPQAVMPASGETPLSPGSAAVPLLSRLVATWRCPDFQDVWPSAPEPVTRAEQAGEADAVRFDWASAGARHIGTVVHRQLQRIAEDGLAQWPVERVTTLSGFYVTQLKAAGMAADQLATAADLVCKALVTALEDNKGRWLLGGSSGSPVSETHSEYKLSGLVDGQVFNGVIDRTFIDDQGRRWIVDFKTGQHRGKSIDTFLDREQERYRDQLERYAGIMQGLEQREIHLGLYFPLHAGWREWKYNA